MIVGRERLIRTGFEPARPLLSIGVFARRSRLSMKALRLYDRLGLLTPADIDPESGYRRYRESQLVTARLVVMLRRLDMPLARVAEIVSAPRPLGVERLNAYWEAFERRVAGQRELVARSPAQWARLLLELAAIFTIFHWSASLLESDRGQSSSEHSWLP